MMYLKENPTLNRVLSYLLNLNNTMKTTLNSNNKHSRKMYLFPTLDQKSQSIHLYMATQLKPSKNTDHLIATIDLNNQTFKIHEDGLKDLSAVYQRRPSGHDIMGFKWGSWVAELAVVIQDVTEHIKRSNKPLKINKTDVSVQLDTKHGPHQESIEFDLSKQTKKENIRSFVSDHIKYKTTINTFSYVQAKKSEQEYKRDYVLGHHKMTNKQAEYLEKLSHQTGKPYEISLTKYEASQEIIRLKSLLESKKEKSND